MAGITSIGAYLPLYRLDLEEVSKFWRARSPGGERTVAGYDEDSITMAVASSRDCLKRSDPVVDGLFFATTTAPYREKQSAAIIASAMDLNRESHTADFANSLRSASSAMLCALRTVKSGSARNIMVTAADCRLGAPMGRFEQLLGDGAATVTIGSDHPIAEIVDSCSIFSDFTDFWRTERDTFVQAAEGRFIDAAGYMPIMQEAIGKLMKKCAMASKDFSKIVLSASDAREHAALARKMGFDAAQIQDPLFAQIGNTGAAAAMLMLVAALEESKAGDMVLFADYGDGCDVLLLRVTDEISRIRNSPTMKDRLARRMPVDYGRYLNWRDLMTVEAANFPERSEPSLASRWRERKSISALYGVQCKQCGTPQFHPIGQNIRICAACQAKDNFAPYRFSDKKARLFSYSIDQLQPTKNPPGLNGVIDFDGGGRLICELTDYDLEKVRIGMPVEMTYRKMYQGQGIVNYFWKARPVE